MVKFTIGILSALVVLVDLFFEQVDVKMTFLHSALEEDSYLQRLEVFMVHGKENMVSSQKRSLSGLKSASQPMVQEFQQVHVEKLTKL